MLAKQSKIIYTVGHSTLSAKTFLELLAAFDIRTVVDVRRFPGSIKNPQYQKEKLAQFLSKAGLAYYWIGEKLGGYRSGGYLDYMQSDGFRQGTEELEIIAKRSKTTIMCSEKLYFRCHRRFISDELVRRGWHIVHIVDKRRIYDHKLQEDLFIGQNYS